MEYSIGNDTIGVTQLSGLDAASSSGRWRRSRYREDRRARHRALEEQRLDARRTAADAAPRRRRRRDSRRQPLDRPPHPRDIVLSHHEWWSGEGYPAGLAQDAIPLVGRIVAVADVFDALTHARPYKPAFDVDAALAEIARLAGRHFDPQIVRAFRSVPVSQYN